VKATARDEDLLEKSVNRHRQTSPQRKQGRPMTDSLMVFGSTVAALLRETRIAPLGPGTPNLSVRAQLADLTNESLLAPHPVRNADMAAAYRAGLWLYHDFLDESHQISQSLQTVEGSYWHGLIHRREPDYANAAYWFRRVGKHAVFGELDKEARRLADAESLHLDTPSPWDPFWFIDYCETCTSGLEAGERFAQLVQQREWELLFMHCYRQAGGDIQS
jgi:hypothetical protein